MSHDSVNSNSNEKQLSFIRKDHSQNKRSSGPQQRSLGRQVLNSQVVNPLT